MPHKKGFRNLITGGAGFLGSHLVDYLMKEGEEVISLDNYLTGRKENLTEWIDHPRFEVIRHDVTEPIKIEVDKIWHLACPASPIHYQYNPIKTAKTSFLGTYNMLGLARRVGAKILLASTSEIYGDPEISPQNENYRGSVNNIGIRSCYDEGKRIAETLCFDYQRMHNTNIRVMRIFNTYGPRMLPNDGRVISNFIMQSLFKKELTIYGDGNQTRSFCYVDDLIKGMIQFMEGDNCGPMNFGNPEEFTIKCLADLIRRKIDPNLKFKKCPRPLEDPMHRKPDISLAMQTLGWEPSINLEAGLDKTISWFKKSMENVQHYE